MDVASICVCFMMDKIADIDTMVHLFLYEQILTIQIQMTNNRFPEEQNRLEYGLKSHTPATLFIWKC